MFQQEYSHPRAIHPMRQCLPCSHLYPVTVKAPFQHGIFLNSTNRIACKLLETFRRLEGLYSR